MTYTCPKCGHAAEIKHPALVAAGKARASKITTDQRKAWGKLGGRPRTVSNPPQHPA